MQISAAQSLGSFALRSSFGLASSSRGSQSSTLSLHDLLDQDEPDLYAATLSILSFGSALGSSASVADAGAASPSQESLLSSIQERLATVQSLYGDAAAATTDEERVQIQAAIDATIADISALAGREPLPARPSMQVGRTQRLPSTRPLGAGTRCQSPR
ncbi:MAG: hypothetical protein R3B96_03815 [Pirellulaceae bacterium]